jgi:hypothetical protein
MFAKRMRNKNLHDFHLEAVRQEGGTLILLRYVYVEQDSSGLAYVLESLNLGLTLAVIYSFNSILF